MCSGTREFPFFFFNPHPRIWSLILEREEGREIEKHLSVASHMCPDRGSNLQPFSVSDDAPTKEPPGQGVASHSSPLNSALPQQGGRKASFCPLAPLCISTLCQLRLRAVFLSTFRARGLSPSAEGIPATTDSLNFSLQLVGGPNQQP